MTEFAFDPEKSAANQRARGLAFTAAERLDWRVAAIFDDTRRDYGEERFVAIAPLDGRAHVCVYTLRDGVRRIISLRKANARERERYERHRRQAPDQ